MYVNKLENYRCIDVMCITGQQLEKDLNDSTTSLSLEKRLSVFDKIFTAYHEARRHIREDLVRF